MCDLEAHPDLVGLLNTQQVRCWLKTCDRSSHASGSAVRCAVGCHVMWAPLPQPCHVDVSCFFSLHFLAGRCLPGFWRSSLSMTRQSLLALRACRQSHSSSHVQCAQCHRCAMGYVGHSHDRLRAPCLLYALSWLLMWFGSRLWSATQQVHAGKGCKACGRQPHTGRRAGCEQEGRHRGPVPCIPAEAAQQPACHEGEPTALRCQLVSCYALLVP